MNIDNKTNDMALEIYYDMVVDSYIAMANHDQQILDTWFANPTMYGYVSMNGNGTIDISFNGYVHTYHLEYGIQQNSALGRMIRSMELAKTNTIVFREGYFENEYPGREKFEQIKDMVEI